jgi:hypothetical protein
MRARRTGRYSLAPRYPKLAQEVRYPKLAQEVRYPKIASEVPPAIA